MDKTPGVVIVNRFTPQPGRLDEFVQIQKSALPRLSANMQGLRGSRLYRSLDGRTATMISVFDTRADFERWAQSEPFTLHRQILLSLMEKVEPAPSELVYAAGSVECAVRNSPRNEV